MCHFILNCQYSKCTTKRPGLEVRGLIRAGIYYDHCKLGMVSAFDSPFLSFV